jgi:hypothetical protein
VDDCQFGYITKLKFSKISKKEKEKEKPVTSLAVQVILFYFKI